jgi:hypothetical protein
MAERMRVARGGSGGNGSDRERNRDRDRDDDSKRMSRIMLARMTTLEEGFRDVLKEVKGLRGRSEDGVVGGNGGGSRKGSGVSGVGMGMGTGGERSPIEGGGEIAGNSNAGRKKRVRKKSGVRVLDGERMGTSL